MSDSVTTPPFASKATPPKSAGIRQDSGAAISRDVFAAWVHDALNHLYDWAHLRDHPLGDLLIDVDVYGLRRGQELRNALLDAIRSQRPGTATPAHTHDWRGYQILELRYLENRSPDEIASRLAISRSLYFREQARVLEALVAELWDRCRRQQRSRPSNALEASSAELPQAATSKTLEITEIERLHTQATLTTLDLADVLGHLQPIVEPLAREHGHHVRLPSLQPALLQRVDRALIRLAVVHILRHLMGLLDRAKFDISTFVTDVEAGIKIVAVAMGGESDAPVTSLSGANLEIGLQLLVVMGGRLQFDQIGPRQWEARLIWRSVAPQVLLVIDDNAGLADLFRRYLVGEHWQVLSATSGAEARQLMQQARPTAVILDVIMPEEDGWDLLVRLRSNDNTRTIPVIVCSILDDPQMVKALGATACLQKPVTRSALLEALALYVQVEPSRPQRH